MLGVIPWLSVFTNVYTGYEADVRHVCGSFGKASDTRAVGREFKSRPDT